MTPNYLVIGASKCATSSLCANLGQHPDVFMTHPKEPSFFSHDPIYARGWDWYLSLFEDAGDVSARGEGSTSYTKAFAHPHAC